MTEDSSREQVDGTPPEQREAESIIAEQVRNAFADPSAHDFAREYLGEVLTNWRTSEETVRRTIILLFFLFFIFEALGRASVSEVSVGPVKLQDYTLLQKLLPIAIAYLYFDLVSTGTMRGYFSKVVDEVVRRTNKSVYENALHAYLWPTYTFLPQELITQYLSGKGKSLGQVVGILTRGTYVVGLLLISAGLQAYIFYRLFHLFGVQDVLVWLSLFASLPWVANGLWTVWHFTVMTRPRNL
jgi:hypothetical protein